jgi:hypothetical protein
MGFAPFNSTAASLPFWMKLELKTKKLYDKGFMTGGQHIVNMRPIEVFIDVMDLKVLVECTDCGNVIKHGDVAGSANYCNRGWFCMSCVNLPEFPIEGYELTFKVRKSKNNPDGTRMIKILNKQDICGSYIQEADRVVEGLEVNMFYPKVGSQSLIKQSLERRRAEIVDALSWQTEKRSFDWIAYIKGDREMWEAGATETEAVQKLIVTRGLGVESELFRELLEIDKELENQ